MDGLDLIVARDPALQIVQTMVVATMAHVSVTRVTAATTADQVCILRIHYMLLMQANCNEKLIAPQNQ
jgi:hypothetical protein